MIECSMQSKLTRLVAFYWHRVAFSIMLFMVLTLCAYILVLVCVSLKIAVVVSFDAVAYIIFEPDSF